MGFKYDVIDDNNKLLQLMAARAYLVLRLSWSLVGSLVGIFLALWLISFPISPFLLASLGGSAVFLFALTNAPAAQPRALFGGHVGGALIGIICYQLLGDALWVYVFAQVSTLLLMLSLHVMHPPAGANPLIMIQEHANFDMLFSAVLLGVMSLFVVAFFWSRVFRKTHRYPITWLQKSPPQRLSGVWQDNP